MPRAWIPARSGSSRRAASWAAVGDKARDEVKQAMIVETRMIVEARQRFVQQHLCHDLAGLEIFLQIGGLAVDLTPVRFDLVGDRREALSVGTTQQGAEEEHAHVRVGV